MNGVNGVAPKIVIEVEGQGSWKTPRKNRNGPMYTVGTGICMEWAGQNPADRAKL